MGQPRASTTQSGFLCQVLNHGAGSRSPAKELERKTTNKRPQDRSHLHQHTTSLRGQYPFWVPHTTDGRVKLNSKNRKETKVSEFKTGLPHTNGLHYPQSGLNYRDKRKLNTMFSKPQRNTKPYLKYSITNHYISNASLIQIENEIKTNKIHT